MIRITKYISSDGVEFATSSECKEYEVAVAHAKKIESILGSRPQYECEKKHCMNAVSKYRIAVGNMCLENGHSEKLCENFRNVNNILLRILSDSGEPINRLIYKLAGRCQCIDKNGIEYCQQYYAIKSDLRSE